MIPAKNLTQRYREQQVFSATPLQRLLMVYDVALIGCQKHDLKRTTDALNLLSNSLNWDTGEVAAGFNRLYGYCAQQVRAGRWNEAERVLRELVQAWVEVLVSETNARQQVQPRQRVMVAG
jgi:flagellin-specific chaperone FliS